MEQWIFFLVGVCDERKKTIIITQIWTNQHNSTQIYRTHIGFNQNFRHSNNLSIVILEFVKETYWKLSLSSKARILFCFLKRILCSSYYLSFSLFPFLSFILCTPTTTNDRVCVVYIRFGCVTFERVRSANRTEGYTEPRQHRITTCKRWLEQLSTHMPLFHFSTISKRRFKSECTYIIFLMNERQAILNAFRVQSSPTRLRDNKFKHLTTEYCCRVDEMDFWLFSTKKWQEKIRIWNYLLRKWMIFMVLSTRDAYGLREFDVTNLNKARER